MKELTNIQTETRMPQLTCHLYQAMSHWTIAPWTYLWHYTPPGLPQNPPIVVSKGATSTLLLTTIVQNSTRIKHNSRH